jgi:hypothetical protein
MAQRYLKFSGNQLVLLGMDAFDVNSFTKINDSDTEKFEIQISNKKSEVVNIKRTTKEIVENRFVCLYFNEGDKYPYSDTVMDGDSFEELENPRKPEMIEMRGQLFVVIDCNTQRIWLSDQRQRATVANWMHEKIGCDVYVKSVISESDFVEHIKSVSGISFAVLPHLFNHAGEGVLSANLVHDIYQFGAEKARVQLLYRNTNLTDTIKEKLNQLISQKDNFNEITVVGKSDDGLDTVFNLEEVISKAKIQVESDEVAQLVDPAKVFSAICEQIKLHDRLDN